MQAGGSGTIDETRSPTTAATGLGSGQAETAAEARLHMAINRLGLLHPGLCAREHTTLPQKLLIGTLLALLAAGLAASPIGTLYALGTLLNLVFVLTILLRLYAVLHLPSPRAASPVDGPAGEELPLYTILVPLLREERVVASLIRHLTALDYPSERLDIKLIFEAGDAATLDAARAVAPPAWFEFVIVPRGGPQTKPKALNYALEAARGDLVVVYDAEDRPDVDQLRKAASAFAAANERLTCLQAGLNYYNADVNGLTAQASIEYASLFGGLLPALQRLRLPIPLGGTSNHFRTDALRAVGGWDAFNVTEDADLGIRIARFGYRCEMLPSATLEEACRRPADWLRQRTRWLKGWLQTYLVHMRHPLLLARQLGARGFIGFQIVLGAQVLSLLAHPLFIVFMVFEAANGRLFGAPAGWFARLFWTLAVGNFIFGYLVSIGLGFATLRRAGLARLGPHLALMPLYWLAISLATFRALLHYLVRPFHWEKTEHGLDGDASGRG